MGASLATRHASHATIDVVGDYIHGKARVYHSALVQTAIITATALIGIYGMQMIKVMMVRSSAAWGFRWGMCTVRFRRHCVGIIVQCLQT